MGRDKKPFEGIVLDLDGVLVDVENSYRRAILESIRKVHGLDVDEVLIQKLKDAGGFNNDWDVTYALALLGLVERSTETVDREAWFQAIGNGQGGLNTALESMKRMVPESRMEEVLNEWNRDELRAVFQELYLGSELYSEIEGESPELSTPGYIHEEPVLLESEPREFLENNYSLGVLTGRPRAEALIALERVNLELPDRHLFAMEDWNESKPNPTGLIQLAEVLAVQSLVYLGDTLDDVRTALRAEKEDPERRYASLGALTGGLKGASGRKRFMEEGATAVLESINDLPEWLEEET